LFVFAESRLCDPFKNVLDRFRAPLSVDLKTRVAFVCQKLDLLILIPLLRDFAVGQLSSDSWDGGSPLKEFLEYRFDVLIFG
jgi:hypothetical protein